MPSHFAELRNTWRLSRWVLFFNICVQYARALAGCIAHAIADTMKTYLGFWLSMAFTWWCQQHWMGMAIDLAITIMWQDLLLDMKSLDDRLLIDDDIDWMMTLIGWWHWLDDGIGLMMALTWWWQMEWRWHCCDDSFYWTTFMWWWKIFDEYLLDDTYICIFLCDDGIGLNMALMRRWHLLDDTYICDDGIALAVAFIWHQHFVFFDGFYYFCWQWHFCYDDIRLTMTPYIHLFRVPKVRHQEHSMAVDFWGLGVLIYELSYGTSPFQGVCVCVFFNTVDYSYFCRSAGCT